MGVLDYELATASVNAQIAVLKKAQTEYKNPKDIEKIDLMLKEKIAFREKLFIDNCPF